MFKREYVPVWTKIILLSCVVLLGQGPCFPNRECTVATDCDDLNPCTTDECTSYLCVHTNNTDPCDDLDPCTEGDTCSSGVCDADPLDADDDGYVSDTCGGNDCDDSNPDVYPGAPEICDYVDNQCPGDEGHGVVDEAHDGMACVHTGCFDMGDAGGLYFEKPVHNVCITGFEMDVHEVTNAEYAECVGAEVCAPPTVSTSFTRESYYGDPAYDDFPVIHVDWNMATDYCTWMEKRLPTEAEWEYAARGGLAGEDYPWGDTIIGTDANYPDSGDPWDNDTSPVEYYSANGYGLYDMAGNVHEWVNDRFAFNYYSVSPANDPQGPDGGLWRGYRGGSWHDHTDKLRVWSRAYSLPANGSDLMGFRCVR